MSTHKAIEIKPNIYWVGATVKHDFSETTISNIKILIDGYCSKDFPGIHACYQMHNELPCGKPQGIKDFYNVKKVHQKSLSFPDLIGESRKQSLDSLVKPENDKGNPVASHRELSS